MSRLFRILVSLVVLGLFASCGDKADADERLKGIACRSVHLGYPGPPATAFYNEITVEQSADGTYFMACGFRPGYFGIQELASGKKVVLFSVWDAGNQNDPNVVDESRRVKVLHQAPDVRVGRFGNEGTGGQCFLDYDWKIGATYRFLVTAKPDGEWTEFAGFFYLPEQSEWKHLVTFSTLTRHKTLSGYYSFVEDFRRNRVSTTKTRRAFFSGARVRTEGGQWQALPAARFTADSNPVLNIDAGQNAGRFFLATGGDTKMQDTQLGQMIRLEMPPTDKPADLPID